MRIVSCVLALAVASTASAAEPLSAQRVAELARAQIPAALETYRDLLSLPNDANFPDDISLVVEWLEGAFEKRGFETQRIPTAGSPLLLASRPAPDATRTVLIYLQADGQPVDPTAWHQRDPYEPVLKESDGGGGWKQIPWDRLSGDRDPDWRIFARSASDSKGPIAQFLAALDALAAAGRQTDFDMKVIVDTEEEMGSPNLPAAVDGHRDLLAADMLVIFDGPPHVSGRPTLDFGARGIATISLTVHGPRLPQHSGHYGNYLPNPAVRLAQIIASMKDDRGRVTIPGFYDGVSLDVATLQQLASVPDDEAALLDRLGVSEPDAVAGSLQQAIQFPSLNVRGMRSAWVGSESRTIVPATATAEIDVRLVLESDPERLIRLVREHIERLGYHLTSGAPTDEERQGARSHRVVPVVDLVRCVPDRLRLGRGVMAAPCLREPVRGGADPDPHLRRFDSHRALRADPRCAGGERGDGEPRQQPAQPERESPPGQLRSRHRDDPGCAGAPARGVSERNRHSDRARLNLEEGEMYRTKNPRQGNLLE